MEKCFGDLKELIDYIEVEYIKITEAWLCGADLIIDFKKHYISDIETNGIIYCNIMQYSQWLNEQSTEIVLNLSSVCSCPVTARVKAQNSIAYKIKMYKTDRHEFGKIPINKCINDLFGIRIILETTLPYEEIRDFIQNMYARKYRCINSSKNDYKAVHLYFKKDNRSFPWELQVWKKCDVESNFISHKKYKQEYTTWEKESREGGIINGYSLYHYE